MGDARIEPRTSGTTSRVPVLEENGLSLREAKEIVAESLGDRGRWIHPGRSSWRLDPAELRAWLKFENAATYAQELVWLDAAIDLQPQLDHWQPDFGPGQVVTAEALTGTYILSLTIFEHEYRLEHSTRIFLSHRGADKPTVQRFASTLTELGFAPWLDVEDMPAGTEIHRGILEGFRRSCAAVFFITPAFQDDRYLRDEINFARAEKTSKGDSFSIIVLLLPDDDHQSPVVPELLRSYVWKEPPDELSALREIVRALPISTGPPGWRTETSAR